MSDYFPQGHSGYFMEDLTVLTKDGMTVDLFECRVCASLTKNPEEHQIWHETIGN